jgi:hypothetical protein
LRFSGETDSIEFIYIVFRDLELIFTGFLGDSFKDKAVVHIDEAALYRGDFEMEMVTL